MRTAIIDYETTGTSPTTCWPIQVSLVDLDTYEVIFASYINPAIEVSRAAREVHGISDDMLADAPTTHAIHEDLLKALEDYQYIAGYNNHGFDDVITNRFFPHVLHVRESFDLFRWFLRNRPGLLSYRLSSIYDSMFQDFDAELAHEAGYDCQMVGRIINKLDLDLSSEIESQKDPIILETMPFGKYRGKPVKSLPRNYMRYLLKGDTLQVDVKVSLQQALEYKNHRVQEILNQQRA